MTDTMPMTADLPSMLKSPAVRANQAAREDVMTEAAVTLRVQAARIAELEGALRGMLGWYEAFPMPEGGLPIPVAATARRVLGEGGRS